MEHLKSAALFLFGRLFWAGIPLLWRWYLTFLSHLAREVQFGVRGGVFMERSA